MHVGAKPCPGARQELQHRPAADAGPLPDTAAAQPSEDGHGPPSVAAADSLRGFAGPGAAPYASAAVPPPVKAPAAAAGGGGKPGLLQLGALGAAAHQGGGAGRAAVNDAVSQLRAARSRAVDAQQRERRLREAAEAQAREAEARAQEAEDQRWEAVEGRLEAEGRQQEAEAAAASLRYQLQAAEGLATEAVAREAAAREAAAREAAAREAAALAELLGLREAQVTAAELRAQLQAAREDAEGARQQAQEAQAQAASLQGQLAACQEQLAAAQSQADPLRREAAQQRAAAAEARSALQQSEGRQQQLQSEVCRLSGALRQRELELGRAVEIAEFLQHSLDRERQRANALASRADVDVGGLFLPLRLAGLQIPPLLAGGPNAAPLPGPGPAALGGGPGPALQSPPTPAQRSSAGVCAAPHEPLQPPLPPLSAAAAAESGGSGLAAPEGLKPELTAPEGLSSSGSGAAATPAEGPRLHLRPEGPTPGLQQDPVPTVALQAQLSVQQEGSPGAEADRRAEAADAMAGAGAEERQAPAAAPTLVRPPTAGVGQQAAANGADGTHAQGATGEAASGLAPSTPIAGPLEGWGLAARAAAVSAEASRTPAPSGRRLLLTEGAVPWLQQQWQLTARGPDAQTEPASQPVPGAPQVGSADQPPSAAPGTGDAATRAPAQLAALALQGAPAQAQPEQRSPPPVHAQVIAEEAQTEADGNAISPGGRTAAGDAPEAAPSAAGTGRGSEEGSGPQPMEGLEGGGGAQAQAALGPPAAGGVSGTQALGTHGPTGLAEDSEAPELAAAGSQKLPLGVCRVKRTRRLRAKILVQGKTKHLGFYETPEEAARAYDWAAVQRHNEGLCSYKLQLNFPSEWSDPGVRPVVPRLTSGAGRGCMGHAAPTRGGDEAAGDEEGAGGAPGTTHAGLGLSGLPRGVMRQRKGGRFRAELKQDGKMRYLGTWDTPEEAGRSFDRAAVEKFNAGEGGRLQLNFPSEWSDPAQGPVVPRVQPAQGGGPGEAGAQPGAAPRAAGSGLDGRPQAQPGRYFAQIRRDGKQQYLGTWDTLEQAGRSFDRAAVERYNGGYAKLELNYPSEWRDPAQGRPVVPRVQPAQGGGPGAADAGASAQPPGPSQGGRDQGGMGSLPLAEGNQHPGRPRGAGSSQLPLPQAEGEPNSKRARREGPSRVWDDGAEVAAAGAAGPADGPAGGGPGPVEAESFSGAVGRVHEPGPMGLGGAGQGGAPPPAARAEGTWLQLQAAIVGPGALGGAEGPALVRLTGLSSQPQTKEEAGEQALAASMGTAGDVRDQRRARGLAPARRCGSSEEGPSDGGRRPGAGEGAGEEAGNWAAGRSGKERAWRRVSLAPAAPASGGGCRGPTTPSLQPSLLPPPVGTYHTPLAATAAVAPGAGSAAPAGTLGRNGALPDRSPPEAGEGAGEGPSAARTDGPGQRQGPDAGSAGRGKSCTGQPPRSGTEVTVAPTHADSVPGNAYRGVVRGAAPGSFSARVRQGRQLLEFGTFSCEQEAARAYDRTAVKFFNSGESRTLQLDFPSEWSDPAQGRPVVPRAPQPPAPAKQAATPAVAAGAAGSGRVSEEGSGPQPMEGLEGGSGAQAQAALGPPAAGGASGAQAPGAQGPAGEVQGSGAQVPAAAGIQDLPLGVARRPGGRFRAQVREQGKVKYLGTYDTPEEAARAYDRAAVQRYNEGLGHAKLRLNFPADWSDPDVRPVVPWAGPGVDRGCMEPNRGGNGGAGDESGAGWAPGSSHAGLGLSGLPRGVSLQHKSCRYRAELKQDGKMRCLGTWDTQEEAGRSFDRAAVERYNAGEGRKLQLNYPSEWSDPAQGRPVVPRVQPAQGGGPGEAGAQPGAAPGAAGSGLDGRSQAQPGPDPASGPRPAPRKRSAAQGSGGPSQGPQLGDGPGGKRGRKGPGAAEGGTP